MESPVCVQCTRFSYDLCVARAQLQQQFEEVSILRKAQHDCADMAAEIQALHACVEEQRRHLQATSAKPKDPGVGIFSWMETISQRHQQREIALRESHEQQLQAMAVMHNDNTLHMQQQVAYLTEQVSATTALMQQAHQAKEMMTHELEMAYRCITEQRRHIQSVANDGASADADIGLLPLVRAGHVVLQAPVPAVQDPVPLDVLHRAHMCFVLATDAAAEELATRQMDVQRENDKLKTEAKAAETSLQKLAAENLVLLAQVSVLNDTVTTLQKTVETTDTLKRVQQEFGVLEETNEKLQVDLERVSKERDALLKGIRHWQGEAQKITADLVTALESRDRYQADQFATLKQCRLLTSRVTELERQVGDMHKFHQLGQQVFGLVQVVNHSLGAEAAVPVDAPAGEAVEDSGSKKKKSKKKKN